MLHNYTHTQGERKRVSEKDMVCLFQPPGRSDFFTKQTKKGKLAIISQLCQGQWHFFFYPVVCILLETEMLFT